MSRSKNPKGNGSQEKRNVVLAYSGGLDTSVAIPWIRERYSTDVIALTVDVGQEGELGDALERAKTNGASEALMVDAKEEFVREFLFPAVQFNALYQGVYPLSTALARPLIAKHLVAVALRSGADAVAHGCTGKGNDQVRFDLSVQSLAPGLSIIAPVREWNMNRTDEIAYAKEKGLVVRVTTDSPYSVDENLWGRSIEGGCLEDPSQPPPEEVFQWTGHPQEWPKRPKEVTIGFERGCPVTMDGLKIPPVELVRSLNTLAGSNGVGRIDHLEDRVVGIKSRETYECPAALVLIQAHQAIEGLVLPRDLLSFKATVERKFADAVYEGLWFGPLREALQAFVESTQATVTGEATVRLFQGSSRVVARSSRYSLLDRGLTTYGRGSTFRQEAAEGFIHLFGLANRLAYGRREEARAEEAHKGPVRGTAQP